MSSMGGGKRPGPAGTQINDCLLLRREEPSCLVIGFGREDAYAEHHMGFR